MGFKDIYDFLNEIIEIKRMKTVERVLIRKKDNLTSYIADHFFSIIRCFVILSAIYFAIDANLIRNYKDAIQFLGIFGVIILFTYKRSLKALIFLLTKFSSQIKSTLPKTKIELVKFYKSIFRIVFVKREKHFIEKSITIIGNVFLILLSLPYVIVFAFVPYILIVLIYSITLSIMVFFNNDSMALAIGFIIVRFMPTNIFGSPIIQYTFAGITAFLIVDYYIRQLLKKIILVEIVENYKDVIIGFVLLNSNAECEIYIENSNKNNLFYVVDKNKREMKIFKTDSLFDQKKKKFETYIRKKIRKGDD